MKVSKAMEAQLAQLRENVDVNKNHSAADSLFCMPPEHIDRAGTHSHDLARISGKLLLSLYDRSSQAATFDKTDTLWPENVGILCAIGVCGAQESDKEWVCAGGSSAEQIATVVGE